MRNAWVHEESSTGCPKKKYLSDISGSEMHMENLDRFGPCQIILDHFYTLVFFGPFGPFWTVLDHFGPFWTVWTILDLFGPFWTVLDHFRPFWTVWTILDLLDHSELFGPFRTMDHSGPWTILDSLDHLGRDASRRFLVQIYAQNLSQILNVCVKVCTT